MYSTNKISLEKAYSFEPIPEKLAASQGLHCLGVQGNMWTEHTPTPADVDRQTWPRLCALAEVGWSPKELRSCPDFLARMESHHSRLNQLGVKAAFLKRKQRCRHCPSAVRPAASAAGSFVRGLQLLADDRARKRSPRACDLPEKQTK